MIFKHCELFLWFFIKYIQNFPYTDFVSWIVLSDTSQVKFFKKRELRPRNVHARSNHEYSRSQNRQKSKYCFWWKEHLSDSCQVRSKLGKITPKSIAVRLEKKPEGLTVKFESCQKMFSVFSANLISRQMLSYSVWLRKIETETIIFRQIMKIKLWLLFSFK